MSQINAPSKKMLSEGELAIALNQGDYKQPHVGRFFSEISGDQQESFAKMHNVDLEKLKAFATVFSAWSGQGVKTFS